ILCVGYAGYAIANAVMLILLYFEDYLGALMGTVLFAVGSTGLTILQNLYGSTLYFGAGFSVGTILFLFWCVFRLNWYVKHLPYYLLSRQNIIPSSKRSLLVKFAEFLEKRQEKKAAGLFFLLLGVIGMAMFMPMEGEAKSAVPGYEKEETVEGNIHDNDSLYEEDDISSVITMHLTVMPGNEADSSNHTWTEVNSYSAYYYGKLGIPRYKTEGILTIDEGNGITEESFGYGEMVPNVSVQVRGQTSSRSPQKNYKIRIKEGKGSFRGQRTLALNKHKMIPYRFNNKLAYDLLKSIPQLLSAKTQFVHLYVTDMTAGGNKVEEDYGIYVMVEQLNKTYLKRHGLDAEGGFYKVNFFEWEMYDAVMKSSDAEDYDREEFEEYLEIKGNDDHALLQEVIKKVNNYQIPITEIIEQHFNLENLVYWMGFQILIGNYDSGARNLFFYNPQNSKRFYIISWDMDSCFLEDYYEQKEYIEGMSWESGMTLYVGQILFRRMLKEETYRAALDDAIRDLKEHYITKEIVSNLVDTYAAVMEPYLFSAPDEEYMPVDRNTYERLIHQIPDLVETYYEQYLLSLERPWPFYVGEPVMEKDGTILSWDISYDIDGETITYDYWLSSDSEFQDILAEGHDLNIPYAKIGRLEAGEYYLKVTATNESGYTTDCFDYHKSSKGKGKIYGCYYFAVDEKGKVSNEEVVD
ncbi:MAG: exopolysaccharide Pel transporter PelG, partial [Muricoprocola sp.]